MQLLENAYMHVVTVGKHAILFLIALFADNCITV